MKLFYSLFLYYFLFIESTGMQGNMTMAKSSTPVSNNIIAIPVAIIIIIIKKKKTLKTISLNPTVSIQHFFLIFYAEILNLL
jgi:hypothetical protein